MKSCKIRVIPAEAHRAKNAYQRSKEVYASLAFPNLPFINELSDKLFEAFDNASSDPNEGWILLEPDSEEYKVFHNFFTCNSWVERKYLSDAEVAGFNSRKNSNGNPTEQLLQN